MEELFRISYPVAAADYTSAGKASTDIKRRLKQLGVGGDVLRRVAVAWAATCCAAWPWLRMRSS